VSLEPNEYVVVGARSDRPGTLGHQAFVRRDEATPVQRLLVIRTGRMAPSVTAALASSDEDEEAMPTPSLALQASCSAVRGTSR
jgi:hypothetical protein